MKKQTGNGWMLLWLVFWLIIATLIVLVISAQDADAAAPADSVTIVWTGNGGSEYSCQPGEIVGVHAVLPSGGSGTFTSATLTLETEDDVFVVDNSTTPAAVMHFYVQTQLQSIVVKSMSVEAQYMGNVDNALLTISNFYCSGPTAISMAKVEVGSGSAAATVLTVGSALLMGVLTLMLALRRRPVKNS